MAEPLLTTPQVAEFLGMRPNVLEQMRCRLEGPPFIRLSRKAVRYRLSDVEKWIAERCIQTNEKPLA